MCVLSGRHARLRRPNFTPVCWHERRPWFMSVPLYPFGLPDWHPLKEFCYDEEYNYKQADDDIAILAGVLLISVTVGALAAVAGWTGGFNPTPSPLWKVSRGPMWMSTIRTYHRSKLVRPTGPIVVAEPSQLELNAIDFQDLAQCAGDLDLVCNTYRRSATTVTRKSGSTSLATCNSALAQS